MANFVSPLKNGVAEGVASDSHDTTVFTLLTSENPSFKNNVLEKMGGL